MTVQFTRRNFLKSSGAATAALVVGLNSNGLLSSAKAATAGSTEFNPFVQIDLDGTVTVLSKHFEMGQGTTTGLTTLVAEELDADWPKVKAALAPGDAKKYANLFFGMQGTGGSTAIANSFMQYREAGAIARDLLIRAAAAAWNVPANSIYIEKGILKSGGKSGHFGEFAAEAAKLTPAEKVIVKTPDQFKLIGKTDLHRKDNTDKTNGTAIFAMDVKVPNMVYVAVVRSPKFGGILKSFDISEAKSITGFIDAKAFPNQKGVAVYAKNTWAAFQARDLIKAEWDFAQAETRSSDQMQSVVTALLDKPTYQVNKEISRDLAAAEIAKASTKIEAEFSFPYLAHAPMEPLNCVLEPTENGVRFHDGCQFPTTVQATVGHILGLTPEQVEVKTVYAGGSFGRRANAGSDYHVEATMAFIALGKKTAVKLVWSREDDIKGGYYRPLAGHKATIGLDKDGNILAWDHRIVAQSILKGTFFEQYMVHEGVDEVSVEGVKDSLYNLPNHAVGLSDFESAITPNWWRSVGHTHTAFAMESLMDMVASESGKDPMDLRLSLLDENQLQQKRLAGVIKAVRQASNWDKPGDRKLGMASHFSFNTFVATVADVTVSADKEVHVNKLYVAIDCGVAVNPDVIKAQMEGGSGYGLGAIMRNEITFTDGEVDQFNFPDYEPLRMSDMPEVDVTIIQSGEAPTGVGEPAVPPVGPAVANAIHKAIGERITQLPMTKAGFSFV